MALLRPISSACSLALLVGGTAVAAPSEEPGLPRMAWEAWLAPSEPDPDRSILFTDAAPHRPAPRAIAQRSRASVADIAEHLRSGDERSALATASAFVRDHRDHADAPLGWMVVGTLLAERGAAAEAAEAYAHVRRAPHPLAPYAAYFEAEQLLLAGDAEAAIRRCEAHQATQEDGPFFTECFRVTGQAHARLGHADQAMAAAAAFDVRERRSPISEQIELQVALWEVDHAPASAVPRLKRLATAYTAPLTGRIAEDGLKALAARGVVDATLPDDNESLIQRAYSMRNSRRLDAAWALAGEIATRGQTDPALAAWWAGEAATFASRTREHDWLVTHLEQRFHEAPNPEIAWQIFEALTRAGRAAEAVTWADRARADFPDSWTWRSQVEEVARVRMLGRDYAGARLDFDSRAGRSTAGRRAQFYAAFSALELGDLNDAIARLSVLITEENDWTTEAAYWRAKAWRTLGDESLARLDEALVFEREPRSWYAQLIRSRRGVPDDGPLRRDGRWPGGDVPHLEAASAAAPAVDVGAAARGEILAAPGFASLTWASDASPGAPALPPLTGWQDPFAPPPSYPDGLLWRRDVAEAEFTAFAEAWGSIWPELPAAAAAMRAGLYDLSGPMFSRFYEDYWRAERNRKHPRHAAARYIEMPSETWRSFLFATRDHHHTARNLFGLADTVATDAEKSEARRLTYPIAHDRYVWTHAREHDLDPFLVLGLMRTESTYNANAVSPVGARGPMQIMPRTGHLMADLATDPSFSAADLHDPLAAVGMGLEYLGLLMRRFDHAWPLAVAAYNGGPHNVSAWRASTGPEMPMDEFVEHIPFRETRDYVKKVSGAWASYLAWYGPDGAVVVPPAQLGGDHPWVVDF